ncbi:MAG TPA: hypothetical protein PKN69_10260, partial [Candidatus Latescibacteria bacterium]|nr:hypothetical protein [Candidatus Latescibacterota bacterium]
GRLPSEWVGGINRNHRAESIGITGRIGSEYAPRRDFQKIGQISRQTQCMHSFSAGRVYETHGCRYCRERA